MENGEVRISTLFEFDGRKTVSVYFYMVQTTGNELAAHVLLGGGEGIQNILRFVF